MEVKERINEKIAGFLVGEKKGYNVRLHLNKDLGNEYGWNFSFYEYFQLFTLPNIYLHTVHYYHHHHTIPPDFPLPPPPSSPTQPSPREPIDCQVLDFPNLSPVPPTCYYSPDNFPAFPPSSQQSWQTVGPSTTFYLPFSFLTPLPAPSTDHSFRHTLFLHNFHIH